MDTVLPEAFTTKHQTNASEIQITPLIVLVLVNATSSEGVIIARTTASSIWYYIINPAESFTISIMRMTEDSQCHVYVCAM